MERVIRTLAAVGLLMVAATGGASAAPPTNVTSEQTGIRCEMPTPLGYASIYVEVFDGGGFGSALMWAPGADPFEEMPTITTGYSTITFEGATLTADFDLVTADEAGAPVGTASVVANLTPDGPITDFGTRRLRDGNLTVRQGSTLQLYMVTGTLSVSLRDAGETTVALDGCGASTYTSTYFGTNPDAWVYGEQQVYVACDWATELGDVSVLAIAEESQALSQVLVITDETALIGISMPELSTTSYQATHELFDLSRGEYVGTASASATLTSTGERIAEHEWTDPHRIIEVGERLSVEGSLLMEIGGAITELTMDDTSCRGGDIRYLVQEKR
jgi:hypothetical protein